MDWKRGCRICVVPRLYTSCWLASSNRQTARLDSSFCLLVWVGMDSIRYIPYSLDLDIDTRPGLDLGRRSGCHHA